MNTLGISILFVVVVTTLFASKRWALVAMTAGILYLTQEQRVEVAGFNLYAQRLVELAGFVRLVVRKEFSFSSLNQIDRTFVLFYVYTVCVFLLRSNEPKGYAIGVTVDALLCYFAFRSLIESVESLQWFLRAFIFLLVPYVALVTFETLTSHNPFSALGGVELALAGDRWVRGGRLRAVGSFGHPSLMGTLGGAFLPVYIGLWFDPKNRAPASMGIVLCLAIVWASNSGGPATCVAAALLGWGLWTMRDNMRWVRRVLTVGLVLLSAAMKAPIWYLIGRLGNLTGGDGFHRAELLNVAYLNLDKWWLAGMPMLATSSWLPYTNTNTGAVDMTNHFLEFGITAGMGSVILMVLLLVRGFQHVGHAIAARRTVREMEALYWGLGVMLWVHLANWFSITYWDQINLVWFMQLAMVGSVTGEIVRSAQRTSQPPVPIQATARQIRPFVVPAQRARNRQPR